MLDRAYRNGISVIGATNLLVENTVVKNVNGTAQEAGVDIEPSLPVHPISNVTFRNCTAMNNAGHGFTVALYMMNGKLPVSVHFENCSVVGGNGAGYELQAFMPTLSAGSVTIRGGSVEATKNFGLLISNKAATSVPLRISELRLHNTATLSQAAFDKQMFVQGAGIPFGVQNTPLAIFYRPRGERTSYAEGNVVFDDIEVNDNQDRPWMQIVGESHGMTHVNGTARVHNPHGCHVLRRNVTTSSTNVRAVCSECE